MPRPRSSAIAKNLPPNLYAKPIKGKVYFYYRRPDNGRWVSLGRDKSKAIRAAHLVNAELLAKPDATQLAARVMQPADTVASYLDHFERDVLPQRRSRKGKPLSQKTLATYSGLARVIRESMGALDIAKVTRRQIAAFLTQFPPARANQYRGFLRQVFAHVVAEGLREDNPVEGTLRAQEVVQRRRLTLEEFERIEAGAPEWFQRVLRLALLTCQRRQDLVALRWEHVRDGYLWITQHKTGAHLRIALSEPLEALLEAAREYGKGAPFVLTHPRREGARTRLPLHPDTPTRWFARIRDKVGVAADLEPRQRPTFHEIRALGAHLMEKAGADPRPLLGHLDPRTTRAYLDRHEVAWIEAVPLSL